MEKIPPKGKVYKYKKLEYWAQGGFVCIEDIGDETDTRFRTISIGEFLRRALTLKQAMLTVAYTYVDERLEDEHFVEDAAKCVREAMNQGDPFDPRVLENYYKHRRRSFISCADGTRTTLYGADGKPIVLHTASQDDCGSQGNALPPIPVAPKSKPFSPLVH